MGSRLRSESGFTLVEVLTAATLAAVGVAATLGVFGSSHHSSVQSQRREVAVQQAQAAIDRMMLMSYADLKLSTQPIHSTNTKSPFNKVNGGNLQVRSGLSEELVVDDPDDGQDGVFVGPERFDVGSGGSKVSGDIYRFISWRNENCPNPNAGCTSTTATNQDTKRLTVAIKLDNYGGTGEKGPMWISTVTADPSAAPPGTDIPPDANPGGSANSAETFYLYDTRCADQTNQQRSEITSSHLTFNTASRGTSQAGDYSTCGNADPTKRPDLMGKQSPPGDDTTPLYKYSNDPGITGYPGGLAMLRHGSSCPTSYAAANAGDPATVSKWNVHAWTSNAFQNTFTLAGRAVVNMYTQTMGGAPGRGMVCATLLSRSVAGGIPTDTVLGSTLYDNQTWPTTPTPVTFSWDLPNAVNLSSGQRLMLVISVRGESANDLVMLYDHPGYKSFLQVATPTPLP